MRSLAAVVLALALVSASAAQTHAAWSFQGLGTLGGDDSMAIGVSPDGLVVVGGSINGDGVSEAFRWESGTMIGLGGLGGTFWFSSAGGVSADGSVVVGVVGTYVRSWRRRPARWEDGILVASSHTGAASDVSADGSVLVGHTMVTDPVSGNRYERATRWEWEGDDIHWDPLGTLGGNSSGAHGVVGDGSVIVGTSGNAAGNAEAFRWEDDVMVGLGTLGGDRSFGEAVSDDGSVIVGRSDNASDHREAFRWEDGVMVALGTLGGTYSSANGVSGDGSVVVGAAWDTQNMPWAFLWTADEGMRPLQTILSDTGLDLDGWYLDNARDISANGRVIVGDGYNPDGQIEAWRAAIPEPSTLILLTTLTATLALLQLPRRKRK